MMYDFLDLLAYIFGRIQYLLYFYVLGGKAIIHDLIYRRYNRVVNSLTAGLIQLSIFLSRVVAKNGELRQIGTARFFQKLQNRSNHVAVITGGARGIGSGVVKMMMQCDMHVVIGCTNVKNGEATVDSIRKEGVTTGAATILKLDLKSLKSVHKFAQEFHKRHKYLNLLVNNAGIMFGPFEETEDGFESQFGVNYLGHFLLAHSLLPAMKEASSRFDINPRLVNVTSVAHVVTPELNFNDINMKKWYIEQAAYAQSKFCLLLFTLTMDRRFRASGSNIQSIAVHPGIVNTGLFDGTLLKTLAPWVLKLFGKSIVEGATTVMYCCIDKDLENAGGSYYSNCCKIAPIKKTGDIKLQDKLYNFSIEAVKQFLPKTE